MSKKRRVPKDPTVDDIVSIIGNARISVLQQAARKLGFRLDLGVVDAEPMYLGDAIAERIRNELVCCNIYERVHGTREMTLRQAMNSKSWHDLCFWGEAAAQIAEGHCPGYETTPNICRCPCEGCKHSCNAHIEEDDDREEAEDDSDTNEEETSTEPLCRCGHTEADHISKNKRYGPQCKLCPEDGERMWDHPFTLDTPPAEELEKMDGLPCFVCGRPQKRVDGLAEPVQCNGATTFNANGNYGSTLFDPGMNSRQHLSISVCDPCLEARQDRVLLYTVTPQPATVEHETWKVEKVDMSSPF